MPAQGTLHAGKDERILLRIAKSGAAFRGTAYSIDEGPDPMPVGAVTIVGARVGFTIGCCSYTATLDAQGSRMRGTLYGGASYPLDLVRADPKTAWAIPKPKPDTSPHKARFVTVEKNIKLEVLDWGGNGRPLIFLAGLGGTAHDFDKFAPRFTGKYHVYAITRRGMGASSKPEPIIANYVGEKLGNDVLTVMEALKIIRPVLAGHSIAGGELSVIANSHPEKVAGLIYLEAAYAYAFYAPGNLGPTNGNLNMDANDLRARITRLNQTRARPQEARRQIDEMLNTTVPQLEADLRATRKYFEQLPPPPADAPAPPAHPAMDSSDAVFSGLAKTGPIKVPALAIFAIPYKSDPKASPDKKVLERKWTEIGEQTLKRFSAGNPKARIVRIPNAEHDVYTSNPDEVEREMNAFIDGLPR
jgi:non-heme chloroperoxidase